jgi:hypothetical protein
VGVPLPFRIARRPGALGLALAAYDVWRRLPPRQRRMLMESARTHGPKIASKAAQRVRTGRQRPPEPRP